MSRSKAGMMVGDDELLIPDGSDYDLERKRLERRRKIATELLGTEAPRGVSAPGVFAMSGPDIGGAISRGLGKYESNMVDDLEKRLSSNERADQRKILSSIPQLGDPGRQQAQLDAIIRAPGIRDILSAQMAGDARTQDRQDEREWKTEQAELNRIERGEQQAADRVARLELKSTPTVQIYQRDGSPNAKASANASNVASQFAGQATQIGIDRNDNPVYRLTKTGKLYGFDENGQPKEHDGVILPKPANAGAPTEAERGAAGYLGRMEAAEKNLTDAKPLPFAQQKGMEKAPGLTNYTLDEKQQVTRQQQEDWVRAKLRKESGAVIGADEMAAEIRTYFPQAGDRQKMQNQKAQSRAQALEQMRSSAGRAKPTEAAPVKPTVVRTGTRNGVRVQQMSDGTIREVK